MSENCTRPGGLANSNKTSKTCPVTIAGEYIFQIYFNLYWALLREEPLIHQLATTISGSPPIVPVTALNDSGICNAEAHAYRLERLATNFNYFYLSSATVRSFLLLCTPSTWTNVADGLHE